VSTRAGLLLAAALLAGAAIGIGGFTFVYARGYSYLTTDPAACANCHIMNPHFDAWLKSSHRAAAGCNDCHTPHALVPKYATKARNGFWHSFYFTTGNFPEPLRITGRNHEIVERACRDCHARLTASMRPGNEPPSEVHEYRSGRGVECTHCHRYVGHWVR
jgi:cytochrome c nitrite reductase small subunit